jgi:hypothetical protein
VTLAVGNYAIVSHSNNFPQNLLVKVATQYVAAGPEQWGTPKVMHA